VSGLAVDGAANVILTGSFASNTISFGGGSLAGANGKTYLVELDPSGAHLWSKNFGVTSTGVASDGMGNVVLIGGLQGAVSLGGADLTSAGGSDVFVAKFSSSGAHLWSKRFGDAKEQSGDRVAVDKGGNILLTGGFAGTLDWGGGGTLTTKGEAVFLVKLDPSGNSVWAKGFEEATGSVFITQIAVDSADRVAIAGQLTGTVDFGGGPLVSAGNTDVFVVSFDADGKYLFGRRFGDGQKQSGQGAAFSGGKNLLLAGQMQGTIDFGGGPLITVGYQDIFLAKLLMP
jgi:hypothetical protein